MLFLVYNSMLQFESSTLHSIGNINRRAENGRREEGEGSSRGQGRGQGRG